jgi:ribose 5-phosphate isomerase
VAYVQAGMVVGLGAGSTAILATRRIGQLLREGRLRDIIGMHTFGASAALKALQTKFGFTPERVVAAARGQLAQASHVPSPSGRGSR